MPIIGGGPKPNSEWRDGQQIHPVVNRVLSFDAINEAVMRSW
jgi:hypothetical protein